MSQFVVLKSQLNIYINYIIETGDKMNNKNNMTIISAIDKSVLKGINNKDNKSVILMDLYELASSDLKTINISKIVFVKEKPNILSEILSDKLNVRCSFEQAEKYQEAKIGNAIKILKKHNIPYILCNHNIELSI